ncbi:MAG: CgeB family protein, partial [Methermicoccaceae archaeon]
MGIKRALSRAAQVLEGVGGRLDRRPPEVLVEEEVERHLKHGRKTVLYVGIRYDYGNREWGLSYEHYNFYHTLLNMDYSLIYFDYDRIKQRYGIERMSKMLRETVYCYHPDFLFYYHFHDWVDHRVWREISEELPTKTIIGLGDDHWRYEETRPVWELFNYVATTDEKGYERRRDEGFDNVLLSQWACNHFIYRNLNLPRVYDITFVGQPYGKRAELIEELKERGVNVITFGRGWKNGKPIPSQSEFIRIYNQSKISLNMQYASVGESMQLKGKDFLAPGCGSLLLTNDTEQMRRYFIPDEEIITYEDADDAAEKIRYYLANDEEREKIAKRGYERVMREHTYERRFLEMFEFAQ